MATTQVQLRQGTAAQNNAFTGAQGEVTVDTTNNNLRVHNGVTPGGATTAMLKAGTANIETTGNISAVGNVTGNFILGNGFYLTGIITSVANINNGTSNVRIDASGGNIAANVGGTANVLVLSTTGAFVTGVISATGNITSGNLTTGIITGNGNISTTGNVTGNYILGNGALLTGVITSVANINNGTSNVTVVSSGGNITVGVANTANVAVFANTGMTVSNVRITGNIDGAGMLNPFLLAGM